MITITAISDDLVSIEGWDDIDCAGNKVDVTVFSAETGHSVVIGLWYDDNQDKWVVSFHPAGHRLLRCSVSGSPPVVEVDIDPEEASIAWKLWGIEEEEEVEEDEDDGDEYDLDPDTEDEEE
jgi:hypothetical protein